MSISDGVKVLIITVCGYTFTYAYYLGYYSAKEIPIEFIDVSLLSMMKIGFGTCAILSFILYWFDLFKEEIEDPVGISVNTKRFLIRHSLGIITMLLFTVNMTLSGKWFSLIPPFMIWYFSLKQDITISFKDSEMKCFRFKIAIKPLKKLGSTIVAEKLNIHSYYVYFSWYLALLFLLFNIGGVLSHINKETLVCNDNIYVINVSSSDVLVTKNHKMFEFMDKKDCKFSIPEVK
ncbi:hypothetical protein NAK94_000097 [Klebsiella aerogenes]|nr:hypothetical protein [Klebsiella aerogenes]